MGGTREPDDGCRVLLQHVSSTHEMRCYSASVDTAVSHVHRHWVCWDFKHAEKRARPAGFCQRLKLHLQQLQASWEENNLSISWGKKKSICSKSASCRLIFNNLAGQTPLGQSPRQSLSEIETPPRTAQVSVSKSDLWDVDQVGDGPAIKPTLASSLLACNCVAKFSHRPATNQPSSWQPCCHPLTGYFSWTHLLCWQARKICGVGLQFITRHTGDVEVVRVRPGGPAQTAGTCKQAYTEFEHTCKRTHTHPCTHTHLHAYM